MSITLLINTYSGHRLLHVLVGIMSLFCIAFLYLSHYYDFDAQLYTACNHMFMMGLYLIYIPRSVHPAIMQIYSSVGVTRVNYCILMDHLSENLKARAKYPLLNYKLYSYELCNRV